jgi:hypothetical protein
MAKASEAAVAVVGIDIGKYSFHVVGLDRRGAIVLRQKWSRGQVEARLATIPSCLIGNGGLRGSASSQSLAQGIGARCRMSGHRCRTVLIGARSKRRDDPTRKSSNVTFRRGRYCICRTRATVWSAGAYYRGISQQGQCCSHRQGVIQGSRSTSSQPVRRNR